MLSLSVMEPRGLLPPHSEDRSMFKNYLSYNLALSFDRECRSVELDFATRDSLIHSSSDMVRHFAASIHTENKKERSKSLFLALICLRDCKEVLDKNGIQSMEIRGRYDVLHARLEQLCLDASDSENGQLRMLG